MKRYLSLAIGRRNLWQIAAIFVTVSLASAGILGAAITLLGQTNVSFSEAFRDCLATIWNPGDLLRTDGENLAYYLCAGIATLIGVILPIYLLGAFVFKLFQVDPIEWRKIVSVESRLGSAPVLRFRFYNASASVLVRNEIDVIARIRSTGKPLFITNVTLPAVLRDGTMVPTTKWSYSKSGIPFTVTVPLGLGITAEDTGGGNHICLPGRDEAIEKSRITFLLLATGVLLESGSTYFSAYEYEADTIRFGHFQEIEPDYSVPNPRNWAGWEHFDENCEIYVFGYGSLVSPASVETTLGHEVDRRKFDYAVLVDWSRAWNVGSDQQSHPERTFYLEDGVKFDGVTVVLGIEEKPGESCCGSVFAVRRSDLTLLDVRERNYIRVNVTDQVTWAGKPKQCVVYTYAPTDSAKSRIAHAESAGRPINVRKGYVDLVEDAFDQIDRLELYRRTTPPTPYACVAMTSVIDGRLAAPRRNALNASYFDDSKPESIEEAVGDETTIPQTVPRAVLDKPSSNKS